MIINVLDATKINVNLVLMRPEKDPIVYVKKAIIIIIQIQSVNHVNIPVKPVNQNQFVNPV